jgi:hypothetical protein
VDVARLAQALDPEAATAGHAVHGTASTKTALQCAACGAAQPLEPGWQCVSCQATLTAPGLAEAHRSLSALGPALRAHAQRPAPHVVAQRLAAQQPALERQRERAAQMQAEADAALGRAEPAPSWSPPPWLDRQPPWLKAGLGAAGLLLGWWLLR